MLVKKYKIKVKDIELEDDVNTKLTLRSDNLSSNVNITIINVREVDLTQHYIQFKHGGPSLDTTIPYIVPENGYMIMGFMDRGAYSYDPDITMIVNKVFWYIIQLDGSRYGLLCYKSVKKGDKVLISEVQCNGWYRNYWKQNLVYLGFRTKLPKGINWLQVKDDKKCDVYGMMYSFRGWFESRYGIYTMNPYISSGRPAPLSEQGYVLRDNDPTWIKAALGIK